jgi:hypothetical protein
VLQPARTKIDHGYFPLSGMVSLLAVMQSGDQIETAIIGREGLVGGSVANGNGYSFGQATVQVTGKARSRSPGNPLSTRARKARNCARLPTASSVW